MGYKILDEANASTPDGQMKDGIPGPDGGGRTLSFAKLLQLNKKQLTPFYPEHSCLLPLLTALQNSGESVNSICKSGPAYEQNLLLL